MSEGGTKKARLAALDEQLEAELETWHQNNIDPSTWQFGTFQFHARIELLTLKRMLEDQLGIDQEDFDLVFKQIFLEEMIKLRPLFIKQRQQMIRSAIMKDIKL